MLKTEPSSVQNAAGRSCNGGKRHVDFGAEKEGPESPSWAPAFLLPVFCCLARGFEDPARAQHTADDSIVRRGRSNSHSRNPRGREVWLRATRHLEEELDPEQHMTRRDHGLLLVGYVLQHFVRQWRLCLTVFQNYRTNSSAT